MISSLKTIATLTIFFLLGLASATTFGNEYDHVDRLALRIEKASEELLAETIHYRHTNNYREMVVDCYAMQRCASRIHTLVHHEVDIFLVEAELAKLDRAFHHVEDLFDRTEVGAALGYGHVQGNTAHVKELLECIEDDIHHLQDDVADIRRRLDVCPSSRAITNFGPTIHTQPRPVIVPSRPVYVPTPIQYRGYNGYQVRPTGGLNIQFNTSRSQGNRGHDHGDHRNRNTRSRGNGHGHAHGHNKNSNNNRNRNRNSGIGFTIGGGSSQIRINF